MIAAGEVVQRPASVVKELVENAVDAGADQVTVVIQDAGRTLIQVIDNGCGMSPDQAVLCFERHATSKLRSAEDLHNILTFGFRGEALASIAAVAEVTLKTRREEDEVGCQVDFADSQHLSTQEIAAPRGANFSVRNLFYNVPARRKFLKSDNVEFKHVVTEFIRVALTRPDIGFTLTHNGKDIYVLRPAKSLKFRIQDVLGGNVAKEIVDIKAETSVVGIYGFAGRPDMARKGLGNQYFFVNGRYFRSPYLHKAVMKAYENLIPEGVTPSYFVYLEIDPQSIDVNIHPTKTEIKFEDDSVVFQILYACIKESLGKNSAGIIIGDIGCIAQLVDHLDGSVFAVKLISDSMTVGKGDDVVLHISVVGIGSRVAICVGYGDLLIVAVVGHYDRLAVSVDSFEQVAALVVFVLGDLVIGICLGNNLTDRVVCISCGMIQGVGL